LRDSIITLTTDFGTQSVYVAVMKGVILGICPSVRLLDLTHEIAPQNLGHAAFFLATTIPYFPKTVIHVIVVDPGVGTERSLLYVNLDGRRLLVPDNGCWMELARRLGGCPEVIRLEDRRFWRTAISSTFHGRDILAPVAAHLSLGIDPHDLGPVADSWSDLKLPPPQLSADRLMGEVLFVDHFGNLITNISGESIAGLKGKVKILVTQHEIERQARTYGEVEPGSLLFLISSFGLLEIAERNGSAAKRLHAGAGTPVVVHKAQS
jgi:S-adenosyl-L-methionine hydrolase (adenosine-forming)